LKNILLCKEIFQIITNPFTDLFSCRIPCRDSALASHLFSIYIVGEGALDVSIISNKEQIYTVGEDSISPPCISKQTTISNFSTNPQKKVNFVQSNALKHPKIGKNEYANITFCNFFHFFA